MKSKENAPLLPSLSSTLFSSPVHPMYYHHPSMSPLMPMSAAGPPSGPLPIYGYYHPMAMPFYFQHEQETTSLLPTHHASQYELLRQRVNRPIKEEDERDGRKEQATLYQEREDYSVIPISKVGSESAGVCAGDDYISTASPSKTELPHDTSTDSPLIFQESCNNSAHSSEKSEALSISFVLSSDNNHERIDEEQIEKKRQRIVDVEAETSPEVKHRLTEPEKNLLRTAHSSFPSSPYPLSPPHTSLSYSTPSFSQSSFQPQASVMYVPSVTNASSHPVPYGQPYSLSSQFSLPFNSSVSLSSPSSVSSLQYPHNTSMPFVPSPMGASGTPQTPHYAKPTPNQSQNNNKMSSPVTTTQPQHQTAFSGYSGRTSPVATGIAKRRANLSKVATDRLKQWLFENLNHPYPTEEEKATLCHETGLQLEQVCNWFINARRRIVQPMLEKTQKGKQPLQLISTAPKTELLSECVLLSKKSEKKRKKDDDVESL